MKLRLLEWLACPSCRSGDLKIDILERPGGVSTEIEEALITCAACSAFYPVIGGIPRMLPDSFEEYSDAIRRNPGNDTQTLPKSAEIERFQKLHKKTQQSFGFEWLRYRVTDFEENHAFFCDCTGVAPQELRARVVLEAGCGMGRFMEVAASGGAEVVGMDLSRSVERARRETKFPDRVHLVQGNIFQPPFKEELFDFIYSIGVLHHTPSTKTAFQSLVPVLKRRGRISIWVYRTAQPEIPVGPHKQAFALLSELASDGTRLMTTRLPHKLLHYLCYSAVPLGWLKRKVHQGTVLKYLLWPALLMPISAHEKWQVRLCDTFDWLSPKYQWKHRTREVMEWFFEMGLEGVQPLKKTVSVSGHKKDDSRETSSEIASYSTVQTSCR